MNRRAFFGAIGLPTASLASLAWAQPAPHPVITGAHNVRIAEFAATNQLPAMGGNRTFVSAGGFLSYGGDFREGWRVAARYVDRILKGAKPGDPPVEQPIKFELAIDLKTANRLGLTLPPSLLLRADQIVE